MKIYHFIFLVTFIIYNNNLLSQNCSKLLKNKTGAGVHLKGDKADPVEILNYMNGVKVCLENVTTKKDSAKLLRNFASGLYNFTFTDFESFHHAPDTLVKIIKNAYKLDSNAFCLEYQKLKKLVDKSSVFDSFYLDLLDNDEINTIKSSCHTNYKSTYKKVILDNVSNKAYRKVLDSITVWDQKYRDGITIELPVEQDALDERNRFKIDSLYQIYGFPSYEKVGKGCQYTFEVLLHSKDCSWNKKWGSLFIEHQKESKLNPAMVAWFFKRFFDPMEGFCTLRNPNESKRYIYYLRKKYFKEIAKKYEYYEYYPDINSTYQACNTTYSYDYSLRFFTKKYVVDQNSISKHLECLLLESKKEIPISALGYIYNDIAQDYDLLGDRKNCMVYIDKFADCDIDLLKILYENALQTEHKKYIKANYLSFYKDYLSKNYNL